LPNPRDGLYPVRRREVAVPLVTLPDRPALGLADLLP
jgi:hypothetical protein